MNISNINDIEVIIRNELITQSQLSEDYVRNALSLYGTDLNQEVGTDIFDTITTNQNLILFELLNNHTTNDVTETVDDKIKIYKSYSVYIIIYGDNSNTLANTLIARLRTEEVQENLQMQGVYIERIEDVESINEFKNDVIWERTDFNIQIACEMNVNKITDNNSFEELSQLTIIGGK